MTYEEIVETLGYAGGQEQRVRITTRDRSELIGVPTSVDTHPTANEVYLRPVGIEDAEVAISIGQIESVQLL